MSSYPNTLITNAGLDLIAEANAQGEALIFTKVKLGDGSLLEGQSIQTMTALISPKLESELTSGSVKNGQAKLRFSVENSGLKEGFWAREVGVFAKVGEEGTETLYAYTNGGNYVDHIPPEDVPIDAQIMDVYIVTGNAATVQIQVDSAAYATVLDLEEHNNGIDAHADLLHLRKPSTAYAVGDIAYSALLPSWARLECVKAGTTDTGDLPITAVSGGVLLSDGSVLWIIDDVRDCTPVGAVRGSLYLPSGYVLPDGATVDRADYPRLVRFATINNLWTSDTTNNAGLFGVGDGTTTMVLPNWVARMAQFGGGIDGSGIGASVPAGLPNITGRHDASLIVWGSIANSGCFANEFTGNVIGAAGGGYNRGNLVFDASRSSAIYGASDTVQPPAIKLLPILRY